ncbi:apsup [Hemileuca sp. nucleopolyhedrovirus]|uniref:Apsup n=1 Tax=Hemileuca sp. nucleopolyhedrovirus TaxID=1367203 RepID=S5MK67_9ABAC|nr:apsup [Hemileuca sp. nucleopolyhedrovirus]AGR56856.1 apsup [Hemileuca sp. nucleopolyhedrovirus]
MSNNKEIDNDSDGFDNNRFCIVFVWYHPDSFVYNTYQYPFWHNVQYHALKYNCYLVYCIEDERNVVFPKVNNLHYINLKTPQLMRTIERLRNMPCIIDYIKLQMLYNETIVEKENLLFVMDMDCTVESVDWDTINKCNRYLEPFFDRSVSQLYEKTSSSLGFQSYIENYAMLLNRKIERPSTILQSYNIDLDMITAKQNLNYENNYIYYQYVLLVQLYYRDRHAFLFPNKVADLQFENCVTINFRRGNSWREIIVSEYDYEYDANEKPSFDVCLTSQLYLAILDKDEDKINTIVQKLKSLNYNFASKFQWSNSMQKYTNVAGVLKDRIKTYDFFKKDFLLPITLYDK